MDPKAHEEALSRRLSFSAITGFPFASTRPSGNAFQLDNRCPPESEFQGVAE